ncbi:glycosyl hydrolase-related protein [Opitutales bacterium]|nr:glycosyl hydrolase-related protein [Opitutales bacterium]
MKDTRRRAISPVERIEQVLQEIHLRMDVLTHPLDEWGFRQGRHRAPGKYEVSDPWVAYEPGMQWGGEDVTAWFRCQIAIPAEMDGCEVLLRIAPGGEGILRVNQQPAFGFDYNHREYVLSAQAKKDASYALELECYFRDAPDDAIRNEVQFFHCFEEAELIVRDRELEALGFDISVALELSGATESSNPELSERLLYQLQQAAALLDFHAADAERVNEGVRAARQLLARELYDHGHDRPAGALDLVGHCHIDLCYIWPYRETVRKNLRTTLIASELMKEFPDYIFSQSQAKLYADCQQYHPDVFAKVKKLAAQKRFEPVGDMWVEPDGNIPCGEAFIRQILYGRQFFKKEFGTESSVCWMPDVFGVSAALPQILVQSGYQLFYTNKQAIWNDTNSFPYNTFWWEGLDGSRIISHIPPTHFIGKMDPQGLMQQWSEHGQKNQSPVVMYTYGFGDGGGGPTKQMLESAKRLKRMDGVPRLRLSTVEEFSQRIVSQSHNLPVWSDELYLEMHRGAQTTKGNLKRLNRQAESALRSSEALCSIAALAGEGTVPSDKLEAAWKMLLECHFHDAVTGTHCTEAGIETEQSYKDILRMTGEMDHESMRVLMDPDPMPSQRTLFNFTGTVTEGHLTWESESPTTLRLEGQVMKTQSLGNGRQLTYVDKLPAFGHQSVEVVSQESAGATSFVLEEHRIVSPYYEVVFNEHGQIQSLMDRYEDREVFAAPGNQFRLYEDKPGRYEAWDIAKDYQQHPVDQIIFMGSESGQDGELMSSRIFHWSIGEKSKISQEIIFYARSRRIDFQTEIDWHEERKMLRVDFPLALRAQRATYEIAFGAIQRSACPSNSYELAKFEVPFHRWMDLSEHGYGVAVLNNGKYGGCVRDGVASLSLLKAPRYPDPQSDIGIHKFTYSLLPHLDDWQSAGVFQEAVLLNTPLRLSEGKAKESCLNYVDISAEGVSIESFKQAEDGRGWILRLVDYFGQQRRVSVQLPFAVQSVQTCTVMEQADDGTLSATPQGFEFTCRPFGIHSFRFNCTL